MSWKSYYTFTRNLELKALEYNTIGKLCTHRRVSNKKSRLSTLIEPNFSSLALGRRLHYCNHYYNIGQALILLAFEKP